MVFKKTKDLYLYLMTPSEKNASIIKSTAKRLGFDFCGIAKARFLEN
ncbi:epoxyqueuosine reductase [Algoriphagus locisalis]|uniref:Epoxyqueuosine reductase n=1 Tax=Algoriphagus locisalis TaxID=305507 RepID=A0A1I7DD56_9BACT|nr:epoxyqueuosine reductase [Algoriphagus locisalis]